MKGSHIAVVVFTTVRLIISVPWLSYSGWKTWELKDSQAMRKRRARTMAVMSAWIIWYLFTQSFRLITAIWIGFRNTIAERTLNHLLILTMVPYFWLRLERCWLLFHDLKISRATAKQEWIALLTDAYQDNEIVDEEVEHNNTRSSLAMASIDSENIHHNNDSTAVALAAVLDKAIATAAEEENMEPSWFLVHWQTYGNHHWLLKRAMIAGMCHVLVLSTLLFISITNESFFALTQIFTVLSVILLVQFPVIIGFYTPTINDIILLRKELILGSYLGVGFGILVLISVVLFSFFGMPYTTWVIVSTVFLDTFLLSDAFLFLHWIPKELRENGMFQNVYTSYGRASTSVATLDSPRSQQSLKMKVGDVSRDPSAVRQATFDLLSDNDGIQLLMTHLMREVSVECLLSVIEFVQFKQWLCGKHCSEMDEAGISASELARRIEDIVSQQVSPNATQSVISVDRHSSDEDVIKVKDSELTPKQLLDCPSRLRRIDFGQWTLPKCVKLSGALRRLTMVERRHPSKHPVIRTVLSLFDKYISADSSLQINVSFLTTKSLKEKMSDLNMVTATGDRTERNLLRLAEVSPGIDENEYPTATDFDLATPAAFGYDERWLHSVSHIWDHCIDEMMVLIQASVQRLILSVDYARWRESSGLAGGQSPSV